MCLGDPIAQTLPSPISVGINDDFNFVRITPFPDEAKTPLIIDPDSTLSSSIAFQIFKSIGG
jgi:hypothetical protein